jgi:tripartite ATP-independent transporter DctM subunit
MSELALAGLLIGGLVVLVLLGLHIGVALLSVGFFGVWLVRDKIDTAMKLLYMAAYNGIADYIFATIPLFVLMGLLVSISNVGKDTFTVAEVLLRKLRGGLGVATVAANTVFAAVTGVSIASAAVFTRVAVPEMVRHGYRTTFATGTVAGSSVLGMLIPPSLLLIIYGLLSQQSIGDLFIAGIVPGLLLSLLFCIYIVVTATFKPESMFQSATGAVSSADMSLGQIFKLLTPLIILAGAVIGGIYAGWFTATESGAIGALGAFILAALRRRLSVQGLWKVLVETGQVTVAILFVIIAANIYTRLIALSGLPNVLNEAVVAANLGFIGLLLIYAFLIVLLGTILDGVSIMLIMVPMFLPLLAPHNIDLIWFGIVTLLAVEIGLLTPPFGIAVFVIKATLGNSSPITLNDIFAGALPFAAIMLGVLLLVIAFPWLATALL